MGSRMEKQTKQKRRGKGSAAGIAAAAVIVVLAVVYCVLCFVAGHGDTLREGTTINGVDIGLMTQEEATAHLTQELAGVTQVDGVDYSKLELDPEVEGVEPYIVDLSAALGYDIAPAVEAAYAHDRGGMFLVRGVRYLDALINGGKSYTILPRTVDEQAVADALAGTGILALNTTVQTTWTLTEETLDFTMGTAGVSVDAQTLTQQIMEHTAQGNYEPIQCPLVSSDPEAVDLEAVYNEVFAEPANATLDVAEDNSYTIVASVKGVDFDQAAAREALDQAQQGSTVSIPLIREDPAIDTATLEAGLFRDVLGEYTTYVSGTAARKSNVKLAGEKCNGTILLPGETFSYNEVVGQRTAEAGFQEAGAYLNGETIQELGGGVCQGSSTLYCAVLYSNLEVVDRRCHTYVSSYVPLGMDATVSWGGPDFVFKNNTDYPIKVVASYANSKITFQIYGTKVSEFTVKITSSTLAVTSPGRKEVQDNTLEVGTEVVEDKGHTGYKVQTYRKVYDGDGNLISESDEAYSVYRMTDQVVRVGTKQPEPETPVEPEAPAETPTEGETDTPAP